MFHEFGHALHGFFADQRYPSLSGTNVARDFVEFPSQFNEHWAFEPSVLAHYAIALPDRQADAEGARRQDPGRARVQRGLRHDGADSRRPSSTCSGTRCRPRRRSRTSTPSRRRRWRRRTSISAQVPPRYRSSYFLHIWANGYAAGYYAYLWTQMLADDAFAWFQAHGGLTRENGDRFRSMVLSRGNTHRLRHDVPQFHRPRSRDRSDAEIPRAGGPLSPWRGRNDGSVRGVAPTTAPAASARRARDRCAGGCDGSLSCRAGRRTGRVVQFSSVSPSTRSNRRRCRDESQPEAAGTSRNEQIVRADHLASLLQVGADLSVVSPRRRRKSPVPPRAEESLEGGGVLRSARRNFNNVQQFRFGNHGYADVGDSARHADARSPPRSTAS